MIAKAEKLAGLTFTEAERTQMLDGVGEQLKFYRRAGKVKLPNGVPPALKFDPRLPGMTFEQKRIPFKLSQIRAPRVPADLEELAFLPVTHLSRLIRARKLTSLALTEMYLKRLKRHHPKLQCVITLTEDLAVEQARRADKEIAAGHYRGPLHGIPWGVKDLLATRGYRTTWGARPFKKQRIDTDATVVQRLTEAGAVLIAKLTVGELAWGDVWFGGKTKTPWNTRQGASGSSAGSGAATAAGLVGFAIGTETWGSIISPSTECGVTGLRPTFGRVSRQGAMALSWSMDKIGPMCRSVEDCALVFNAIYGPDGQDLTVVDHPFNWGPNRKLTDVRLGYVKSTFEKKRPYREHDDQTLAALRRLGFRLIPIELPAYPVEALQIILRAEAAAAFDELTRSDRDELLVRQIKDAWPNLFRHSRLIPAVEYIQANRIRHQIMQAMAAMMEKVDVYVAPSYSNNLLLTNLTGHPAVVVPNGFKANGVPTSITFTGRLYDEATALAVAKAYQDTTHFHLQHPHL
jgi:Asp-tRNA(Asn)/Glu-tRNA(Gln) amidotransferase A subunit family amidase